MMRTIQLLVILVLLTFTSAAGAQTSSRVVIDEFEISKWVTENMQALNIPSIAVGIVGAKDNYYLESFGPAELEQPFLLGSLSKSVTAMAVMLLVHDKVVSLDDPASKYVDGVPDAVTVRHLLYQTSGLQRADGLGWTDPDASLADQVSAASFEPVGTYSYSNLNYDILGAVVAKASGKPYGDFVKRRIFTPAGLENTSAEASHASGRVKGHQYMFGFPVDMGEPPYNAAAVPSGFVWMSANDMTRYLRLFVTGGKLDGKQVIPAEVITQLLEKPEGSSYAMGWLITNEGGSKYAKHTGATAAFTTAMAVVPEREFGVFVFTNLNLWMGLGTTNIMNGILSPIMGTPASTVTNVEFVVRLGFGIIVALILFTFLFEFMRWFNSRFPTRLSPKERNGVALTLLINVIVVVAVTQYFGTPIDVIVTTQPDLGYGFLITVICGSLRRLFTGFNKTAHLLALAGGEDDDA